MACFNETRSVIVYVVWVLIWELGDGIERKKNTKPQVFKTLGWEGKRGSQWSESVKEKDLPQLISVRSLPLYVSIVCLCMGYLIFHWVCGWFIMYCNLVMVVVFVRTYVFLMLRTYVMILCNWLILWQNALYLYLGRLRMCLNTSRNHVSRSSVEAFKFVQENKLIVQIH